ncbi:sugar/nucleoside kinase (ribokinase family) [Larkinella arboricola]|uniref:Sugar/nucleoside kinase (Ribokinase family) n=1 Tax=Larkinella arboricola TaxID=643671 RepID=A0A327WQR0_LARAB|nr:sugar kinase [Larkinella arboricola]RAJ90696.1 sugar/nucleoside kinase (ribokinase family) [Larkinella arboricola]
MEQTDLLVVGELNVDILLDQVKGFPVVGQEILADKMLLTLGSSSAIFASNISALGSSASFCGALGNDLFGKFILRELQSKRVDTRFILESNEHQTGITMILNYDQDRANVTYGGAMNHFSINDIPLHALHQFRHLHVSSYFLQSALRADITNLFAAAKTVGLSTSLDLQWDPANQWEFPSEECLPYVDFFLPNEKELLCLTGQSDVEDAIDRLSGFANIIVVKKGINGATAYSDNGVLHSDAYINSHFVDAIGAGDSFNAGFINGFLNGHELSECLRLGNLAGAINTTAAGGTTAFANITSVKQTAKQIFNLDFSSL